MELGLELKLGLGLWLRLGLGVRAISTKKTSRPVRDDRTLPKKIEFAQMRQNLHVLDNLSVLPTRIQSCINGPIRIEI